MQVSFGSEGDRDQPHYYRKRQAEDPSVYWRPHITPISTSHPRTIVTSDVRESPHLGRYKYHQCDLQK
jgi:hypothetical protein